MERHPMEALATHCQPINRAAALGLGDGWEDMTFLECPSLSPVSPDEMNQRRLRSGKPAIRDITGLRRDRMVIIGLFEWRGDGRSLWVAKCDCGRFEFRRYYRFQRGIAKGKPDACRKCEPEWDETKKKAAKTARGVAAPPMHPDCTAPDCDCEPGIECAARGAARGVKGGGNG